MSRPQKNDIDSGIQGWDGKIDDNDEVLFNGPLPIHEHTGDETDLESTFPAAAYDRCLVFVNDTQLGWVLYASNGSTWNVNRGRRRFSEITSTVTQSEADEFVQYTGAGTVAYTLLPAAEWSGQTLSIRNDKGSGTLNVSPDGSELINGSNSDFVIPAGNTATIYCNGTESFASLAT